jgi:tRNA A-37 threonylcarbamoyl transferase component Bud32
LPAAAGVAAGPVRIRQYELGPMVSKTRFSEVFKARSVTDKEKYFALKKIEIFEIMEPSKRNKILREAELIKSLNHPHIVGCVEHFIEENVFVLVFDWAAGGDLKRLVKRAVQANSNFDERTLWSYLAQISDAVAHMHERRVLHRDIKPANIFIAADGSLKVGDLGLGREFSSKTDEAFSKVGTPLYMSPEVIQGSGYDWKSDVWSVGCVLYELAMLRSPFRSDGSNIYGIFKKIKNCEYDPVDAYSLELRQCIHSMLQLNPELRPTAQELHTLALAMEARHSGGAPFRPAPAVLVRAGSAGAVREDRDKDRDDRPAEAGAGGAAAGGGGLVQGQQPQNPNHQKPATDQEPPAAAPIAAAPSGVSASIVMETVLEKLRLLDYDRLLVARFGVGPFSPFHFAFGPPAGGRGDEGTLVYELAVAVRWLCGLCGLAEGGALPPLPSREDDPSALAASMCAALQELGVGSGVAPGKLRPGWGEVPCVVLNNLANLALKAQNFAFRQPDLTLVAGRAEVDEAIPEEQGALSSELLWEEEEGGEEGVEGGEEDEAAKGSLGQQPAPDLICLAPPPPEGLEPVRVVLAEAPWQVRVDHLLSLTTRLSSELAAAQGLLGALARDLSAAVAAARARERHLAGELAGLLEEGSVEMARLKRAAEARREVEAKVSQLADHLATLDEELAEVRARQRGPNDDQDSDSPIDTIKTAIRRIRAEIQDMDMNITLLQATTTAKTKTSKK